MKLLLESWKSIRGRSTNLSKLAGAFAVAAGAAIFLGWATGFAPLTSVIPGLASAKPNSALGFAICGTALLLFSRARKTRLASLLTKACGAFVLALGLLTLAEDLFHTDYGIDALYFASALGEPGANPGRMSAGSALCFAFAGVAFMALPRRAADWSAISIVSICITMIAGNLYSWYIVHELTSYASFPIANAFIFGVIALGILSADPDRGLLRELYAKGPSGTVLRRLLPAAALIPTLLAWLAQDGERHGLFVDPLGLGAMAAASIVAFAAVIWVTARSIDASEARRTALQAELVKSEANFRDLFDSAPVGLSHSRPDGSLIAVNNAFVRMLGYENADALNQVNAVALYATPAERIVIREELATLGAAAREVELLRADGTGVWVQLHSRVIDRDGGDTRYESAFIDLTERKRLEQQFVQAQKMEAVGRLAGGVAHDFNNMLTVIRSYCDLVVLETPEGSPIRADLREISRAADQAAALSRQLLAFSRKQVMLPQVFNPNAVVSEAHTMLRHVVPSAVRCELKLDPNLESIRADPGSINQILMNLGINASDAMPDGGTLLIETTNCSVDATYAVAHAGLQPGRYVCVEVTDTGAGMDAETLSHIYEPFFTTKAVGKGTGLGLATVYGIVQQSHGHVQVESAPGRGTRFRVYFPRVANQPEAPAVRATGLHAHPAGPARTVLLVEDDDSVRASIARILSREGYTVLSASHGGEGMRLGREHAGAIDLVISDVMMPEMGGRQFVTRLTQLHPESRVLLISGYTDDEVLRKGQIDPRFAFLAKPFSVEELVQKVDGVLEVGK